MWRALCALAQGTQVTAAPSLTDARAVQALLALTTLATTTLAWLRTEAGNIEGMLRCAATGRALRYACG